MKKDELEKTQELFDFLKGKFPDGYKIRRAHRPKLTADQAWTVIWYLGNQYWQVPDFIERCCICGDLYDSNNSGECLDFGKAPYHFCDDCRMSEEYAKKSKSKLNPNKTHEI